MHPFIRLILIATVGIFLLLCALAVFVGDQQVRRHIAASSEPGIGWRVERGISPMNSLPTVKLWRPAGNEIQGLLRAQNPQLQLLCEEGKLEVYVHLGIPVQTYSLSSSSPVRLRLDNDKPQSERWIESISNDGLYAADGAATFGALASGAKRFAFEFHPMRSGKQVVLFDLTGLEQVYSQASRPCGWDFDQKGEWRKIPSVQGYPR